MSHRHGCLQVQLTRCHLFGRGVTSVIFHDSRYSTHLKKQQQRFQLNCKMAMSKIKLTFNIQRDREALERFDRNNLRKYFWFWDEHHMDVKCCVLNTNCLQFFPLILELCRAALLRHSAFWRVEGHSAILYLLPSQLSVQLGCVNGYKVKCEVQTSKMQPQEMIY